VRDLQSDFVFPASKPKRALDITKAWRTALRKAGIENFRFHDLRHSAASYLAMNNASLVEIAAILGHRTLQMVKRYAHVANSHTSSVVRAMNDKVFGKVSGCSQ
jgi:integrase